MINEPGSSFSELDELTIDYCDCVIFKIAKHSRVLRKMYTNKYTMKMHNTSILKYTTKPCEKNLKVLKWDHDLIHQDIHIMMMGLLCETPTCSLEAIKSLVSCSRTLQRDLSGLRIRAITLQLQSTYQLNNGMAEHNKP